MAKDTTIQENLSELQEAIHSYVNAKLNYWKITLIEKLARGGTYLFTTVLLLMSAIIILLLLAFAFSFWFADYYGTISQGLLISAGAFLIIIFIIFLLRRKIFANSIVKNMAEIIFEDKEENQ